MEKNEWWKDIEVGDTLKCRPEPGGMSDLKLNSKKGGAGYAPNKIFKVGEKKVSHYNNQPIVWPENMGGGIYVDSIYPPDNDILIEYDYEIF